MICGTVRQYATALLIEQEGYESTPMNSEPWVSIDEVARHLSVSRDTVYRWLKDRGMPAHRVGHQWKFKLSSVDQWVESGQAGDKNKE